MNLNYSVAAPASDPLHTLNYKLERLPSLSAGMVDSIRCPVIGLARNCTYIVRAPFDIDFTLDVRTKHVTLGEEIAPEIYENYITLNRDTWYSPNISFQITTSYMFWTDEEVKGNAQLWIHDVPSEIQTEYKNYYVMNGLLPKERLDRIVQIPIVMREGESRFVVKRGDPLMAITIIADEKVILTHQEEVPDKVHARSVSKMAAAKLCPYKYAKNLFSRFF